MRYLFIGAHHDDVEFSCGGTILRLVNEGHDVYIAVMTDGGSSLNGSEEDREVEQLVASQFAQIKKCFFLGHKDGNVTVTAESVKEMAELLAMVKPHTVFTHYPDDSHQDHRAVSDIVKSATRRAYNLVYFDSYSSQNFHPNLYIDISEYADGKVNLLKKFHSQIEKYAERNIDFIRKAILINEVNGYECRCPFAEGYIVNAITY